MNVQGCNAILYSDGGAEWFYVLDIVWVWRSVGWEQKRLRIDKYHRSFPQHMLVMGRHEESYAPSPPYYYIMSFVWSDGGHWCQFDTQKNF